MSANYTNIMSFVSEQIGVEDGDYSTDLERLKELCSQLYMIEVNPSYSSHLKKKEMKLKIDHFSSLIEGDK